jgi:hypothetical protein
MVSKGSHSMTIHSREASSSMLQSPGKTLTASHRGQRCVFTLEEHVKMESRMISSDVLCHRANSSVATPRQVQFIQKGYQCGRSLFLLVDWWNRQASGGSGPQVSPSTVGLVSTIEAVEFGD